MTNLQWQIPLLLLLAAPASAQDPSAPPKPVPVPSPPVAPLSAPVAPPEPPVESAPGAPTSPASGAPPGLPFAPVLPPLPPGTHTATLTADVGRRDDAARQWVGRGHVTIAYLRYTLTADEGLYDEATDDATLRGNVRLDTGQDIVTGGPNGVLVFHFRTRTWDFQDAVTSIKPQGLLEPVHVSASTLSGNRAGLNLQNVRVTTCDPAAPEYEIVARNVTLIPNSRIIARHATVYLFRRKLITLPVVSLPITRSAADRPPIVPEIGQSTEEGAFIKTNLNYVAGRHNSGAVRVDLLQKQGLGLGFRDNYTGGGTGEALLYGVVGGAGRTLTSTLRDHRKLLGFTADLDASLRHAAYQYEPGTSSQNANLNLARSVGASDTTIALRYDGSSGFGSRSTTVAPSVAETYRFDRRGSARLNLDYTSQTSTGYAQRQLASAVDVLQSFNAGDVEVAANKLTRFNAAGVSYLPTQRLPELIFKSDALRLGFTRSRVAPMAFLVSTGRFISNGKTTSRQVAQADAPPRILPLGSASLNVGGGFRQAVYAKDAALYTLSGSATLTQPLGHRSDFALAYNIQSPRGYTPFQFDRPFAYNSLDGTVRVADVRASEVRVGTGYDFDNRLAPWRDLVGYVKYQPGAGIRFITNVAVNVNGGGTGQDSAVRYVNNALRLRLGRFHFDGESRYQPGTGTFGRLLGNLSTPLGRHYSIRALAGTDSGQRYRHVAVTRDLGCLEATVAVINDRGWRNQSGFTAFLRIKAFPIADPFSNGMFGENLDIGGGDITYGGISSAPPNAPGSMLM